MEVFLFELFVHFPVKFYIYNWGATSGWVSITEKRKKERYADVAMSALARRKKYETEVQGQGSQAQVALGSKSSPKKQDMSKTGEWELPPSIKDHSAVH